MIANQSIAFHSNAKHHARERGKRKRKKKEYQFCKSLFCVGRDLNSRSSARKVSTPTDCLTSSGKGVNTSYNEYTATPLLYYINTAGQGSLHLQSCLISWHLSLFSLTGHGGRISRPRVSQLGDRGFEPMVESNRLLIKLILVAY